IEEAEAALRVVQLRRGDSQIQQHAADGPTQALLGDRLAHLGEAALDDGEARVLGGQCLTGGDGLGILVEAEQTALRAEMVEDAPTVSTAPEGAVQVAAARTHVQRLDGLLQQYGDMAKRAGHSHRVRSSNSAGIPPGFLTASRSACSMAFQAFSSHSRNLFS